jgi:hypothetical protein
MLHTPNTKMVHGDVVREIAVAATYGMEFWDP